MKDKTIGYIMAVIAWLGALCVLLSIFMAVTNPPRVRTYPIALNNPTACELKGGENATQTSDGRCLDKKGRLLK